MKPSEYRRPKLICIKEFTFEDSDACEFVIPVGKVIHEWFGKGSYFNLNIEEPLCYDYCTLSPEELDEYFELYNN